VSGRLECLSRLAKPLDVELNCTYRQLSVCAKSSKEKPYTVRKKVVDCQDPVMGIEEECL